MTAEEADFSTERVPRALQFAVRSVASMKVPAGPQEAVVIQFSVYGRYSADTRMGSRYGPVVPILGKLCGSMRQWVS